MGDQYYTKYNSLNYYQMRVSIYGIGSNYSCNDLQLMGKKC